jgi:predicted phage-related endonuclease
MKVLDVIQGSPEWRAIRAKYPCASEAPIIMGASRHMTRGELLRLKAAGMEKEFSDYVQRMVLDKGHQVEGPAGAITEQQIGDELYPATAVDDADEYLASFDGVTMLEHILTEHKQWSEELAAAIRAGATEFPDGQEWQLEQQLLVCKTAEKVIFVCSDGTAERRVQMEYRRVPGRAEQLRAGWKQFHQDLAAGVAPPAPPKAVAASLELLPAVNVRMEGALKVVSNLDKLEPLLRAFIDRIPVKPSSDEDFATTDAACKALKRLEEELDRSEASALASLEAVEQMQRLKVMLHKLSRDTRLQKEKLVEARKLEIRTEEIKRGKDALAEFVAGLNTTIGRPYMPVAPCDFAACIKGLRTVQSVRDAIDQHLADCKLAANDVAGKIMVNMRTLREQASEHAFLFADVVQIVLKAPEDLQVLVRSRIDTHEAAEKKKADDLREQIRAEEQAKPAATPAPAAAPAASSTAAAGSLIGIGDDEHAQRVIATTHTHSAPVAAPGPAVIQLRQPAPESTATIRLGVINERLAPIQLTAEGLATLGFPVLASEKGAKLDRESDLPRIRAKLIAHLEAMSEQLAA